MAQVVRKKPDHWHHRDLRRALMNAALAAIEKGGVEAVNTRSLAKRAGVSTAAPYHHFENRHGLLVALAFEGFEELLERADVGRVRAEPASAPRRPRRIEDNRHAQRDDWHLYLLASPVGGTKIASLDILCDPRAWPTSR
jgi:AcrR family transcriptional regulator